MAESYLARSNTHKEQHSLFWRMHIDVPLFFGLCVLIGYGLLVLYSAGGENFDLIKRQIIRLSVATIAMFFMAQIPPRVLRQWALPVYVLGLVLLVLVLLVGETGKGAQRWLNFGVRFQPSELMKLALPLMLAWYMHERKLPPRLRHVFVSGLIIIVPTLMIAKQPDLGTSLIVASAGIFVLFLAGISWRFIALCFTGAMLFLPILWNFLMRPYQRQRVLTLFNPESDPLGAGYHINQSKIAIGSGGVYGKGWLNGTQSQLEYLPERQTDFIFAVLAEEFGLIGILILLAIYVFIIWRGLYISTQAQDSFGRLVCGSIILTFFVYVFVNIGMVSGILPVVGLPLPLISYGGTSLVTIMASLGILMSVQTHRRLLST